jgi:chromate transporter
MNANGGERPAGPGDEVLVVGPRPSLKDSFREFLLIGITSFGGGRTAYFQDALVKRRRWLTDEEFLEAVAVSQILPGPNIGNLAAYLGQRLRGGMGAVVAVLCLTIPGALSILGLAWLYYHGMPASVSEPVGKGVSAASAGLASAAVWRLRKGAGHVPGYAVAGLTFLLFGPLHWPILAVLAVCLPVSLVVARQRR